MSKTLQSGHMHEYTEMKRSLVCTLYNNIVKSRSRRFWAFGEFRANDYFLLIYTAGIDLISVFIVLGDIVLLTSDGALKLLKAWGKFSFLFF